MLFCESLVSFTLSIDLLNERVSVQCFGVNQFAVHNATLGKGLTDGNRVNIVKTVALLLGVELIALDELCHSALYLRPGHFIVNVCSCNRDVQGRQYVAAVFLGEPSGCVTLTGVVCHIANHGTFAFNVAVPSLQSFINFSLCYFTGDYRGFNCSCLGLVCGFCNAYRLVFGFLG